MQIRIRKAAIAALQKLMKREDRSGSHIVSRLILRAAARKGTS